MRNKGYQKIGQMGWETTPGDLSGGTDDRIVSVLYDTLNLGETGVSFAVSILLRRK